MYFSGLTVVNKISGQREMVTSDKYLFTCFLFLLLFLFSPKNFLSIYYGADILQINYTFFSLWSCFISSLYFKSIFTGYEGFPSGSAVKNLPAIQEMQETWAWSQGSIPAMGRSPGGGNGSQYSCQEHPTDRGAWLARAHGVAEADMPERARLHLQDTPGHETQADNCFFYILNKQVVLFSASLYCL